MDNCRLIMSSGVVIKGRFSGFHNVIGKVTKCLDGSLNIQSKVDQNNSFQFLPEDKNTIMEDEMVKVVVDDLTVDFHLYDLKTLID